MSTSKDLYILLRAKDMASKTIKGVSKQVGGLRSAGAKAGAALKGLAIGAAAVGGTVLVASIKSGIDSLAELESATTSVQGALEQMGLAGQITGKQVADWANEIEAATDAAFDDKAITRATTTLVRYGNVAPKNLRKTMEVMTDLAAKTGDVESASTLLAKALADPAKAAGKLSRVGIVLTKTQQDQIKAMVKAGDAAGAQALLLDILAQKTTGAAKAMSGPYQDAMAKLGDAVEDTQRALAVGFLPVIQDVADWLSKELVKPSTIQGIRDFGKALAGGLREAVKWARSLPWDQIVSGLKSAAGFAKTLIDAFMAMPTEVKGLIIGLAGLNKLTGGAIGGIVSELGKGLIKGVLGITAGVVNLTALKGIGGLPGLPGGGAGGAGGGAAGTAGGGVASLVAKYVAPFLPAAAALVAQEVIRGQREQAVQEMPTPDLKGYVARLEASIDHPGYGPIGARRQQQDMQELARAMRELGTRTGELPEAFKTGLNATTTALNAALGTVHTAVSGVGTNTGMALRSMSAINSSTQGVKTSVANNQSATTSALAGVKSATASGLSGVKAASNATTAAINRKNFDPTIVVRTAISIRNIISAQAAANFYNALMVVK